MCCQAGLLPSMPDAGGGLVCYNVEHGVSPVTQTAPAVWCHLKRKEATAMGKGKKKDKKGKKK